ncbi:DDE-type integrase/transposase/recombinase [uncultured Croceicoccus sp.]|uniref:DDE-type integrase/transposase/recombinase n=1 Tax=uncultured Croceicoccus sp. TaxID=1295329 RepID=UPI0034509524
MMYLGRAVDHEDEALESSVTMARDKAAALRFMKKALKHRGSPEVMPTDGLRSYRVAMSDLGWERRQEIGHYTNNCAQNSHLNSDYERERCCASGE